MNGNIPSANFLFMLAYAFDLSWQFFRKDARREDIKDLTFFELLVFVLVRWTEELVKRGLYRSFIVKQEPTRRLRGKILFEPTIRQSASRTSELVCQFDDLSFDTLENQVLLATLRFCHRELQRDVETLSRRGRRARKELEASVLKLSRLLSTEVSRVPLSHRLFDQLTFHRTNINYKPILVVCRLIYESAGVRKPGEQEFLDVDESKMNQVFEAFLRNYLIEQLTGHGYRVKRTSVRDWTVTADEGKPNYIPAIEPDIVVLENDTPRFVLDAKFYKRPLYSTDFRQIEETAEDGTSSYRTHGYNLHQLISYLAYYNCDGLLVYAQTELGHFSEYVQINSTYYKPEFCPPWQFGFFTLDLSGQLEEFRRRLNEFVEEEILQKMRERRQS